MSRLLVVEDDPDIALALRLLFSRAGYEVAHAGDGRTGLKEAYAEHPDLVVLDVGLPEMDGWQVLERLRDVSDVPVLVLTAHGQEAEKVRGLRGGADDYLTKPFALDELHARLRAVTRREPAERPVVLAVNDLTLDPVTRVVRRADTEIMLSPKEYALLAEFMRSIASQIAESRSESLRQPGRPPRSLTQHRKIADAIRMSDPKGAAAAMRRHVQTVSKVRLLNWNPNDEL